MTNMFNPPTPRELAAAGNIHGGRMGEVSIGLMRAAPSAPRVLPDVYSSGGTSQWPFAGFGLGSRRGNYGAWDSMPGQPRFAFPGQGFIERSIPDFETPLDPNAPLSPDQIDLQGDDLEAFISQLDLQFRRAGEGRATLVREANRDEEAYNQTPYSATELPFEGALSLRVPAARSRVDKAASELGATFDRDGSPVFGATPLTASMAEIAPHVESFVHQNLTEADAINQYRLGILRSFKVGTSFLVAEVISRPVTGINRGSIESMFSSGQGDEYENALVVRSVKMQDMYVLPVGISDMKDAGFVGERFQMPRWKFNDMIATGFYAEPVDDAGQKIIINNGVRDDDYGLKEEHSRLNVDYGRTFDTDPAGMVDLVKAWVKFQVPSLVDQNADRRSRLYYVVFPANNPRAILRLKDNPYTLLDHAPYVPMPAGMGDGTIWGESWMRLLRSLQHELDTLHMLHIEAQKRAYSRFYLVKEDSLLSDTLKARAVPAKTGEGNMNPPQTVKRIMPDEWFETGDPMGDIKDFSFSDINPGFSYDENRIISYMNNVTIDDMPTSGSVRTAFELRTAAAQTASKLKAYLKTISSRSLKPHIEIVKAMLWEYKMPSSAISEYVRFMEYGDVSTPITMTDFFTGVSLDPAGTTTSADETVAITTTASLTQEILPAIMNIPGIVPDVPTAARELIKARVQALGFQKWATLFGLTPPTQQDMQKNMMYMLLVKQMSAGTNGQPQSDPMQGMMGQGGMGGDGGMVMGAPGMNLQQGMTNTQDSQGGAMAGLAPAIAQQMGGMPGQNA